MYPSFSLLPVKNPLKAVKKLHFLVEVRLVTEYGVLEVVRLYFLVLLVFSLKRVMVSRQPPAPATRQFTTSWAVM